MINMPFSFVRKLFPLIIAGYVVLFYALYSLPDSYFHLYFLNIGQGSSVLIKTPENHKILIDGGPKDYVISELSDVLPFFDRSIDLLVLTHPDLDHLSGLIEVVKRYDTRAVLLTGIRDNTNAYTEFLREINEKQIPTFFANSLEDYIFGSVALDVLYPFEIISGKYFENINNSSIALKVLYESKSLLITGDLEKDNEELLVSNGVNLKSDILSAGHHGSKTSSSELFLSFVSPEMVIIQCGKDNPYGHPHPLSLRAYNRANVKKVRRTDTEGRIELTY